MIFLKTFIFSLELNEKYINIEKVQCKKHCNASIKTSVCECLQGCRQHLLLLLESPQEPEDDSQQR